MEGWLGMELLSQVPGPRFQVPGLPLCMCCRRSRPGLACLSLGGGMLCGVSGLGLFVIQAKHYTAISHYFVYYRRLT